MNSNTFGYKVGLFFQKNAFEIGERPLTKDIHNYDIAYVKQRYKEIHDFIHVLTDLDDVGILNEVKVKYFEFANLGLPSCMLGSALGKFLLTKEELIDFYFSVPELARKGKNCDMLLGVYFEKHLEEDFQSFKNDIGLI